jgi:hypothetical protein
VQTFICEDSAPILRLGEQVAGTVRQAGRGKAWLLGTFVGHNGTAYRDARSRAAIAALLAECGVTSQRAGELLWRKRRIAGKEAWIFSNPTAREARAEVDVAGWSHVEDLLGEPLQRVGEQIQLTMSSLDVRALILLR